MAKHPKNIQGLDHLDKLLDSLVDPKFRKAALRNAAKQTMIPVENNMRQEAPSMLKNEVKTRITVNTGKQVKGKGFIAAKKFNEMYSEVTFDSKKGKFGKQSAYGMAMILNYGRQNPLAKVKGDAQFHAWGKSTQEAYRYIGTTNAMNFVDKVRFESEPEMEANFRKIILAEIEKQIKRQDRQIKRKAKV